MPTYLGRNADVVETRTTMSLSPLAKEQKKNEN